LTQLYNEKKQLEEKINNDVMITENNLRIAEEKKTFLVSKVERCRLDLEQVCLHEISCDIIVF